MIRIILGFSVALIALFCFAVAGLLAGKPAFEVCRPYLAGAMAVAGVTAWFVGRITSGRKNSQPRNSEEDDEETFSLRDLRYWGPMLVILGVITLFIWPIGKSTPERVVQAPAPKKIEPVVPPPPKPVPPVVVQTPPVAFPELKIQGVIVRDDSSFAIINGKSYSVGDHVGEVVIRAIERESVVVELNGRIKLLTIN